MKATLTTSDLASIRRTVDTAADTHVEQIASLVLPALESVEVALSHQLEDLSGDTALGFAEVHGKIEFLRSEINEIKQTLHGLFR